MLRGLAYFCGITSICAAIVALGSGSSKEKSILLATSGLLGSGSAVYALASTEQLKKYKSIPDVEEYLKRRRNEEFRLIAERQNEEYMLISERKSELSALESDASYELGNIRNQITKAQSDQVAVERGFRKALKKLEREKGELARLREIITIIREEEGDAIDICDSGFGPRRYIGLDSPRLIEKLKANREKQKQVAKNLLDECKNSSITISDSVAKGRAFVRQNLKALLRGFNGECDAAISTLSHSNDSTVLKKLERAYSFYKKQASERVQIPWTEDLLHLKYDEACLVHESALAKKAEREEQIELRQQEREEVKARKEAEEAEKQAERERQKYVELLNRAKEEAQQNDESDELLSRIAELEKRVKEAEQNKERAISRAQLTKSGHVYVISNIGSFGHNVFKVGMTRRLDPTDRVRELGDASVPFPFDVHAMIYTDDAPGLERAIHNRINSHRLNLVNLRREFFTITWQQLIVEAEAAARDIGVSAEIRWTKIAEADQYRQSVSERFGTGQSNRFFSDYSPK